jgi:hypothetical protein
VAAAALLEFSSYVPNRLGYSHVLSDTIDGLSIYLPPGSVLYALTRLIVDAVFVSLSFFFLLFFAWCCGTMW